MTVYEHTRSSLLSFFDSCLCLDCLVPGVPAERSFVGDVRWTVDRHFQPTSGFQQKLKGNTLQCAVRLRIVLGLAPCSVDIRNGHWHSFAAPVQVNKSHTGELTISCTNASGTILFDRKCVMFFQWCTVHHSAPTYMHTRWVSDCSNYMRLTPSCWTSCENTWVQTS